MEKAKLNSEESNRIVYDDQTIIIQPITSRDYKMLQDFLTRKYGKAEKSISTKINK